MKRVTGMTALAGLLLAMVMGEEAALGQWSSAQLLNLASESGVNVKNSRVAASRNGGFHAIYILPDQGQVRYRRYTGSLSSPLTIFSGAVFNGNLCEALNGDVHVVFEDWRAGGPEVGWVRSTNGGASFSSVVNISSSSNRAKHPQIAALGTGTSPQALMSYFVSGSGSGNKELRSNQFNGTSWLGQIYIGSNGNSEYEVFGIARSPVDGSVYRAFDSGGALKMRRYDGSSWGPEIVLDTDPVMHNRQRLAVNDAGQVMCIWDANDVYYSVIYTPGSGVGSRHVISSSASWGKGLCAIPGTNNFYVAYPRNDGTGGILVGRKWAGGGWLPEETISVGLSPAFTVDGDLSADPNGSGTIYCVWEYWGNGRPQQYYSIRAGNPPGPTGTLQGTVRNQFGLGVPGTTVTVVGVDATVSGSGGSYSLVVPVGTYTVTASKNFYSSQTFNNVSITSGGTTTRDFTINGQAPGTVTGFTVTPGSQFNRLNWTNSTSGNYSGVTIRFKTTGFPTSVTDGTLMGHFTGSPGAASQQDHTGLTNGTTYYYAAFAYFEDVSRYYAAGVTGQGTPAGPADLDRDGDVDLDDFARFQNCLSGQAVPQNDPNCVRARMDADSDVDGDDLVRFRGCFSGAGIPSNPNCN